jgi:hypothetical protein
VYQTQISLVTVHVIANRLTIPLNVGGMVETAAKRHVTNRPSLGASLIWVNLLRNMAHMDITVWIRLRLTVSILIAVMLKKKRGSVMGSATRCTTLSDATLMEETAVNRHAMMNLLSFPVALEWFHINALTPDSR